MQLNSEPTKIGRLKISQRDLRMLNFLVPVMWVMFAYGAYMALAAGRVGEGIAYIGLLIVFFCALVGPYFWGIVTIADVAFRKVLAVMTALGILITATGWVIRIATWAAAGT